MNMTKKRKLGFLSLPLLAAGWFAWAATSDTVITVTTFADENGGAGSTAACSLREAVVAVNERRTFGGCPAGARIGDNIIQLEAGSYDLSGGELAVKVPVLITGESTTRSDEINPLTGNMPNRVRPLTTINAAGASRIFNTEGSNGGLVLRDLVLANGRTAGKGGAIYAAVGVSLDNVVIENSEAVLDGGAIFLASNNASLSATGSVFRNNHSDGKGGVLAMSCSQDLSPLAQHDVLFSQSLLLENSSLQGAGAVEGCGNTSIALSASTLSKNESLTGAIAYAQPVATAGSGQVSFSHVTAVEHAVGAVLFVDGIATTTVSGSILGWNTGGNCVFGTLPPSRSSTYNALEGSSCSSLGGGSSSHNVPITASLNDELAPLGDHKGLTDIYLPRSTSVHLLDKGEVLESCTGADQRGISRQSGSACDIGAAERLQVTALDDTADSRSGADRMAIINILANDRFSESDSTIYELDEVFLPGPSDTTDPAFMYDAVLYGGANPVCSWRDDSEADEKKRRRLVVDNGGVETGTTPIVCQYRVSDTNNELSKPAKATANIKNFAPVAVPDTYVRRMGVASITFNPLENDHDDNDGVHGSGTWWITASPPIYVSEANQPRLGHIDATKGPCVDSTLSSPKECYFPPLTYVADNVDSPFSDRFSYVVYDKDGLASASAIVTIKTDAKDPDKGETGSLDVLFGLFLALLGWRRACRQ